MFTLANTQKWSVCVLNNISKFVQDNYSASEKKWIYAQINEDLTKIDNIDSYVENVVMKNALGFNHEMFKEYILRQQEEDAYIRSPLEVEEGIIQCIKCSSFKVFSFAQQTRSADEPITTFAQCSVCKTKWSHN